MVYNFFLFLFNILYKLGNNIFKENGLKWNLFLGKKYKEIRCFFVWKSIFFIRFLYFRNIWEFKKWIFCNGRTFNWFCGVILNCILCLVFVKFFRFLDYVWENELNICKLKIWIKSVYVLVEGSSFFCFW